MTAKPSKGGAHRRGTAGARPLSVAFFQRPSERVAADLVGTTIVSTIGPRTVARIVEVEAYLGFDDPASHGFRHRRTAVNGALFSPPGNWYVYLSYGLHWCANLVSEWHGAGSAVLLRALEPLEGIETMRKRRGGVADAALCSGPGKLCQALGMTRDLLDGVAMRTSSVVVYGAERGWSGGLTAGPRIGITKAADWPLRFSLEGSPWVSRPRPK